MRKAAFRVVITPGEPAGIGPDLVVQLAQEPHPVELVAVADPDLLRARAETLGLPLTLIPYDASRAADPAPAGQLTVWPVPVAEPVQAGHLHPANAAYVLRTLDAAIQGCISGEFAALVTGPVQKSVINDAGIAFSGHTEYLAAHTGGYPVMLLATPGLRVALVTTHLPLAAVPGAITESRLAKVLDVLHADLGKRFGFTQPRILVCGLNPHAGESGHLGREEIDTIIPVLERYRQQGWQLRGPLPADTLFTEENLRAADAVLAMYHDQGLPVLKHKGFGQAVNITLGLPIIRTSVDHGTALDLAGSGKARVDSLRYALEVALEMIRVTSGKAA